MVVCLLYAWLCVCVVLCMSGCVWREWLCGWFLFVGMAACVVVCKSACLSVSVCVFVCMCVCLVRCLGVGLFVGLLLGCVVCLGACALERSVLFLRWFAYGRVCMCACVGVCIGLGASLFCRVVVFVVSRVRVCVDVCACVCVYAVVPSPRHLRTLPRAFVIAASPICCTASAEPRRA